MQDTGNAFKIKTQTEWLSSKKNLQIKNAGEDVEKREHSCNVGKNINWYSHNGKQYGNSLENYHMTQKFQYQAHTLRKPQLKQTHVP